MQFILQKHDNYINLTLENKGDVEEVESFLRCILPMFYEIKTKIHSFNDENFKKYIQNYKNHYDEIIKQKENEIIVLKQKQIQFIKQKENEIQELEDEKDKEIQKLYVRKQNDVKQLQEKISVLENEFQKEREKIKNQVENMYENETNLRIQLLNSEKNKEIELLKQKIEHITSLDKFLENNYNQHIDLHNTIKNHFEEKQLSTSQKGKIGEQYIMNELQKLTLFENDAIIDNVSGKSEAGDIFLKLKELNCCIEVKNHTIDIRQKELDKFRRDIQDVRYNCGIFISLYSPIVKNANINNFEIKIINKKPCIYLVNFEQNPENLYLAIKTLLFLLQNNEMIDNDTQYYIQKLNKTIENFNKLQENCNLVEQSVKNSKIIIQNELQEIYKLLKLEENKEFHCDICAKTYKTIKTLEKHKNEKH